MTRSQIARVLREAAMYAHYTGCRSPYFSMFIVTMGDANASIYDVEGAFAQRFYVDDVLNATSEECVIAMLFAAEAVEG